MKKDKIFDQEIQSYLIELGIEKEQIDKLSKKKLKEYAIFVLNKVIEAIESRNYASIKQYLSYSPAGDCMGCENTFINFGGIVYGTQEDAEGAMDIEALFNILFND